MLGRRQFLVKLGAAITAGGAILSGRAAPVIQRAIESPRYILNPETGVWFERVKDGVYHAILR